MLRVESRLVVDPKNWVEMITLTLFPFPPDDGWGEWIREIPGAGPERQYFCVQHQFEVKVRTAPDHYTFHIDHFERGNGLEAYREAMEKEEAIALLHGKSGFKFVEGW